MSEEVDEITANLQTTLARTLRVAIDTARTYKAATQRVERDYAAHIRSQQAEARAAAREIRAQQVHELRTRETARRLEILDQNAEFAKELTRDQLDLHRNDEALAQWAAAKATADLDPDIADAYDERLADAGLDPDAIAAEAERLLAAEPGWSEAPISDVEQRAADSTVTALENAAHTPEHPPDLDDTAAAAKRLITATHPPDGAATGPTTTAPTGVPAEPNAAVLEQALQP
jgi:hypothetical protein